MKINKMLNNYYIDIETGKIYFNNPTFPNARFTKGDNVAALRLNETIISIGNRDYRTEINPADFKIIPGYHIEMMIRLPGMIEGATEDTSLINAFWDDVADDFCIDLNVFQVLRDHYWHCESEVYKW